jgi:galactokinase
VRLTERVEQGFVAHFGHAADGICFAPGRVNLIGDHVDYNDGLVLPMPIAAGTAVAWAASSEARIEAVALDFSGETVTFALADNPVQPMTDWRGYLRGMAAGMAAQGLPVAGAKLAIAGNLPRGAGLSSSASLCIAVGRALSAAAAAPTPNATQLALAAQRAEHDWAGVQCGIMDQLVIAAGKPATPLLIDCQNLAVSGVALPDDWAVLIVQSGVRRGLVDGEYNARRADCSRAAAALGLASLRDLATNSSALAALDPGLTARARHVVSEIDRVRQAIAVIAAQDLGGLGRLLNASHSSLRDDFSVSHPDVDRLVAILQATLGEQGGARMTGGGFGGAVVAVMHRGALDRVCGEVRSSYQPPDGEPINLMIVDTDVAGTGVEYD